MQSNNQSEYYNYCGLVNFLEVLRSTLGEYYYRLLIVSFLVKVSGTNDNFRLHCFDFFKLRELKI